MLVCVRAMKKDKKCKYGNVRRHIHRTRSHTSELQRCTYAHITIIHLEKNKKLAIEGAQDGRLSFPYIPGGENLFPLRQPRAHVVH